VIERNHEMDEVELQQDAIAALADECGQPIGVVAEVYRAEFARLKEGARVHDFVPLFAARRTRAVLARRLTP